MESAGRLAGLATNEGVSYGLEMVRSQEENAKSLGHLLPDQYKLGASASWTSRGLVGRYGYDGYGWRGAATRGHGWE
jgi:hypothetical protein